MDARYFIKSIFSCTIPYTHFEKVRSTNIKESKKPSPDIGEQNAFYEPGIGTAVYGNPRTFYGPPRRTELLLLNQFNQEPPQLSRHRAMDRRSILGGAKQYLKKNIIVKGIDQVFAASVKGHLLSAYLFLVRECKRLDLDVLQAFNVDGAF